MTGDSESESVSTAAVELLHPHLPSLSRYWLAALQDRAHLTLPPEFASQLPPNGGTFYTVSAVEIVRPYYEANWTSLLHAAAIWLKTNAGASLPPAGLLSSPPGSDHAHLVLGLAVQSLCTSATLDQPLTLNNCLQALKILVCASTVKEQLSRSNKIVSELLSVLHRVLLTCPNKNMHSLALQISQLIGGSLSTATTSPETELTSTPAYSLLKVAACCLFRQIPGLESLKPRSTAPISAAPFTQDIHCLIDHSLPLLVTAISLCPSNHIHSMLPSALHMLLSALEYTSSVGGATNPASASVGGATSAGLAALRELCSVLKLQEDERLVEILRSGLASVLAVEDESGAVETYPGMGEETRLLVMSVFLLSSLPVCPPHSTLHTHCTQLLNNSITGNKSKVPYVLQLSCFVCVCVCTLVHGEVKPLPR